MNSDLSPDLIIIDNYIDLVGKSVSSDQYSNLLPFFCTASEELKFRLGSYISIEKSLNGYRRIITYLHERFKNAKLIFLSFPSDGYKKQHEIHKRKIQFDSQLKNLGADLCLNLHLNSSYYLTVDSQHFKPAYYAAVASSIYSLLS